jgi:hypothetical protein
MADGFFPISQYPAFLYGVTLIFREASQPAEWFGSAIARSAPPSSSAIVNVTFGNE